MFHYGVNIEQIIRDIEVGIKSGIGSLALRILDCAKCSGCSNKRFGQENRHGVEDVGEKLKRLCD